jgi:hypothetical protein
MIRDMDDFMIIKRPEWRRRRGGAAGRKDAAERETKAQHCMAERQKKGVFCCIYHNGEAIE